MTEVLSVALVDDEPELRDALRVLLETRGYAVRSYASPDVALRELVEDPVDVVVTDLRMDAMSGTELALRLRARHPRTGVIVITGYASLDTAVEALRAGCSDFLEKPVRGAQLFAAIERATRPERRSAGEQDASSRTATHVVRSNASDAVLQVARFLAAELARDGHSGPYRRRMIEAVLSAVENVRQHAYGPEGGPCEVRIVRGEDSTDVIVRDEGRGFESASANGLLRPERPGGLMRALASIPGLRVESRRGAGTRITFPIDREELSQARSFARWSVGGPMSEERALPLEDAPWWTPHLSREHSFEDSSEANSERTARDVLWL